MPLLVTLFLQITGEINNVMLNHDSKPPTIIMQLTVMTTTFQEQNTICREHENPWIRSLFY